jgi:hypothetical protein
VLAHGEPGDQPVAAAGVLHGGVDDVGVGPAVDHADPGVEHLADHQHLVGALRERAQVHLPRGQRHRARVDAGDPQHRHEDAPPRAHAHDQAEHPRRARAYRDRGHRVAHATDVLTVRAQHRQSDHAGHEHPGHGSVHTREATASPGARPSERVPT